MATPRIITARSMELKFRTSQLSSMGPEQEVTGHYSGTPRAKDWKAGISSAKSFHHHHQVRNGWAGIGYHYLIPDDGAIICCRPVLHAGAHVDKQNDGRVGVNMPGTTGDRPTRNQARAFNWLLHHAHTDALPRAHRTDRDLSRLPIFGHREVRGQNTKCPGLFLGMYKRGGDPFADGEAAFAPAPADDFVELTPGDEEFVEQAPEEAAVADAAATGPDEEEEAAAADISPHDEGELPEAAEGFDEDLTDVLAEIEAGIG